ncbi:hypothetical protein [Caldimonas sp. KR1-144]
MSAALQSLLASIPEDAATVAGIVLGGYLASWAIGFLVRAGLLMRHK